MRCLYYTAIDCGPLRDPVNGQVNTPFGTTYGNTANYTCNHGFELIGASTQICHSNISWIPEPPFCIGKL